MKRYSLVYLTLFVACTTATEIPKHYSNRIDPSALPQRNVLFNDSTATPSLQRNIIFILDGSSSMKKACGKGTLQKLIHQLEQSANHINPSVHVSLLLLDQHGVRTALPHQAYQADRLRQALTHLQPGGRSHLGIAIQQGVTTLAQRYKQQLGYGTYDIVLITDSQASDASQLLAALNASYQYAFINVHTLVLCQPPHTLLQTYSVQYITMDVQQADSSLQKLFQTMGIAHY